ncbi:putative LRR receptor-like serine/threonine-protein kinase RFK1 [Morus notabilis]|uniref:non-specific serine/threonine protein kinase n=1 Tax=Morus notabilis TaxID=981085 RepID=W9SIM8_9ROSA|nr:putative LRR receptor-like serine/threonine-protein kinase RFK1 [Morus notabilis]
MAANNLVVFFILAMACFGLLRFCESKLPQDEVDALAQITSTMGSTFWEFNATTCDIIAVGLTREPPQGSEGNIGCDCTFENNTVCHVLSIVLKGYSLPGKLPPQLSKLPYLKEIDFGFNYLNGTIPREWGLTKLTNISILVNRLSGEIPKELSNITTLTYVCLDANQFSGTIPPELGRLPNLQSLLLSSNQFTGNLPTTFADLENLTDLRMSDNNFSGSIPDFVQNWKQLQRLNMEASGLEGPLPLNISQLTKLEDLRISDMRSPGQNFPMIRSMGSLTRLVLRNCNISGEIPSYFWTMKNQDTVDFSYNKLVGEIPETSDLERMQFLFLTGNMLSGNIPDSLLRDGTSMNLNLNLYHSSSTEDNLRALPCLKDLECPRYSTCWHVNSGGVASSIKENNKEVVYEGDGEVEGGTAKYFLNQGSYWGFSSTGDFMDDNDYQNTRYVATLTSSNLSDLYRTARISPISLTYFHRCLENGNYSVNLHFAEIQFTNDQTYKSLGRRFFDIYLQERLVREDFNIEDEAGMAQKALVLKLHNVTVTNNALEIRLLFTGKGTTRIPTRGVYGPLISAVSVISESKKCSNGGKKETSHIIIGVVVGSLCPFFLILGILCWKGCFKGINTRKQDFKGLEMQTGTFTLKQIKAATDDFDYDNKIGEGGFGPVYKGQLPDGTAIAVKQLSSQSRQGNREFLNEIGMISCVQHPNLVKLHGCCIEADQLMLVYEYMENNSLARALFGRGNQLRLDWPTRHKICIGIARGLAFLHEESRLKIVHRDIKATNVLLDADLNPKISDFGLARLDEEEKTHISTRIAGTIGYMAPEYALWGHLTYKADVYSFGVVTLEIVSGKNNNNYMPSDDYVCLLDWACHLQQSGNFMELVDENLGTEVDKKQAEIMIKVALLCTSLSASLRPTMSEVVSMLEERTAVPEVIPEQNIGSAGDLRFKAMKDLHKQRKDQSFSGSQTRNSTAAHTFSSSFPGLYEINTQSTSSSPP